MTLFACTLAIQTVLFSYICPTFRLWWVVLEWKLIQHVHCCSRCIYQANMTSFGVIPMVLLATVTALFGVVANMHHSVAYVAENA